MIRNPLADAVAGLAAPVVESLGLVIWGVEIVQSGRMVVRLFVDIPPDGRNPHAVAREIGPGEGGASQPEMPLSASIDQCEEISRHLGLALEVEDLVPQAYVLEVSTPGFNRLFFAPAQMRPYVGDMVEARMQAAYVPEGAAAPRRTWRGRLERVEDDAFVLAPAGISPDGEILPEAVPPVRLPWEMTRRVARVHVFRAPEKPGKGNGRPGRRAEAAAGGPRKAATGGKRRNDALDDDVASALED